MELMVREMFEKNTIFQMNIRWTKIFQELQFKQLNQKEQMMI